MTDRKRVFGIILALIMILGGILAVRARVGNRRPLGESQLIQFEGTSVPDDRVRQFLEGDFVLIKKVASLPAPILKAYTEVGGSRPVLADPRARDLRQQILSWITASRGSD